MHSFFRPAFALIARYGLRLNCAWVVAFFTLNQVIVLYNGAAMAMLVSMLLTAYLLAALVFWTTAGMDRINKIIERVASGDLSGSSGKEDGSLDVQSGAVLAPVAHMTRNLVEIVNQVRASADRIAHAAGEIAAGNAHLSKRTEEQASALEETGASMEELAATVKQNAESCIRARASADDVNKITAEAAARMSDLARTMGKIEGHSHGVAEITGVIESIAFQTNILALNAAVEAARAG
jgi:methyl-accepting chemotaxis protein